MQPHEIFKELTKKGFKIAYIENVTNTIVLAESYPDISEIEKFLKENKLNYMIINSQSEVTSK